MFIFAQWETEYQLVFGSDGGFVLLFVLSVLTFNIHNIMTQNKKLYSQPKAELLVVRFEQNIMSKVGVNSFSEPMADIDDQSSANWWD